MLEAEPVKARLLWCASRLHEGCGSRELQAGGTGPPDATHGDGVKARSWTRGGRRGRVLGFSSAGESCSRGRNNLSGFCFLSRQIQTITFHTHVSSLAPTRRGKNDRGWDRKARKRAAQERCRLTLCQEKWNTSQSTEWHLKMWTALRLKRRKHQICLKRWERKTFLSPKTSKDIQLTVKHDKRKQQIVTFKSLEHVNLWRC